MKQLSQLQQRTLDVLATGATPEEAASMPGTGSRASTFRWLKLDRFREALENRRAAFQDALRRRIEKLRAPAVVALEEALASGDMRVRLNAAQLILKSSGLLTSTLNIRAVTEPALPTVTIYDPETGPPPIDDEPPAGGIRISLPRGWSGLREILSTIGAQTDGAS